MCHLETYSLRVARAGTLTSQVSTGSKHWKLQHNRNSNSEVMWLHNDLFKARLVVIWLFIHQRLYRYQKTGETECRTPCWARPCPDSNSKHSILHAHTQPFWNSIILVHLTVSVHIWNILVMSFQCQNEDLAQWKQKVQHIISNTFTFKSLHILFIIYVVLIYAECVDHLSWKYLRKES